MKWFLRVITKRAYNTFDLVYVSAASLFLSHHDTTVGGWGMYFGIIFIGSAISVFLERLEK